MKFTKFSLVDLKVEIPAVEETKEGLLSGGFTFLGSEGEQEHPFRSPAWCAQRP